MKRKRIAQAATAHLSGGMILIAAHYDGDCQGKVLELHPALVMALLPQLEILVADAAFDEVQDRKRFDQFFEDEP
jgi:hypothetical protein